MKAFEGSGEEQYHPWPPSLYIELSVSGSTEKPNILSTK